MPSEELAAEITAAVEDVKAEAEVVLAEVVDEGTEETTETTKETTEEATTEEITEVVDEKTEETTQELDGGLLERAISVGIPVADAREVPPESLDRIIKSREDAWERDRVVRGQEQTEETKEEVVDPFADLPKLDPEVHDAGTIAMFDKLTAIAKSQHETIQGFNTRQEETSRATEAASQRDTEQWFDEQVANLGEDFTESLGSGRYGSLDPGSPQVTKRNELADQVAVLLAGYNALEVQALSREQVFDTAARLVLQKEYQQIHDKKLSGDLGKQAGQHIQRAGGRRATSKETPMEEAARIIDEKYPSGSGD